MTSINIIRDDAANHIDPKTVASRIVKQVSDYPSTQAFKVDEDVAQAPRQNRQKEPQRRKNDRRKNYTSVLLDTRSGHDRRNIARSEGNHSQEEENTKNSTGINIYT